MEIKEYTIGDHVKRAYRWGKRQTYMNGRLLLTAAIAAVGITMCSENLRCSSSLENKVRESPESVLDYSAHSMAPQYSGGDASENLRETWNQESYSGPDGL